MKRMAVLLVVTIAGGWQISAAEAQVQLERKFVEGTSYKNNVDIQSIQSLKINGMDIDTNVTQYMTIVSSIGTRGGDGRLKIEHKMDSLRVQMMIPQLGDIKFDSANPDATTESLLTPILKAAAKASWSTVLDKNNLVVAVTGRDEAFNTLDDNLKKLVQGQYEPEYLKDAAQKEAARIPATPVKPDDTWEQSEVMRIDATQILTFLKSYTYRGPEMYNGKMLDRIDVKCLEVK
ncbi:MAG: DUF6263 family protein, partial [Planctomycetaceae bacterium]